MSSPAKKSESLEFTCPDCGDHRLEEIMVDVTVASRVTNLVCEDGVGDCEYGEQTNDGGVVDRYQCEHCGFVLKDTDGMSVLTDLGKVGQFITDWKEEEDFKALKNDNPPGA